MKPFKRLLIVGLVGISLAAIGASFAGEEVKLAVEFEGNHKSSLGC